MATETEITLQFLDELRDATSEWVDANDVNPRNGDQNEHFPSLAWRSDSRPEHYGITKPVPFGKKYNSDGNEIGEVYREYERLRFDVEIQTLDIAVKLRIKDAIKKYFTPYWKWGKQSQDFHQHCQDFAYDGASGSDDPDSDPVERATVLNFEIEFFTLVTRTGVPIETIHENYTVDGDAVTVTE